MMLMAIMKIGIMTMTMIMRVSGELETAYLRPSTLSMIHALADEICPHGVDLERGGL